MGYSCNAKAAYVMDEISAMCVKSTGSSNTWTHGKNKYFYERGRENDDGAITGSVWKFVMHNGEERVRRSGSYRINGDGVVQRFPTMSANVRIHYTLKGLHAYNTRMGPANGGQGI